MALASPGVLIKEVDFTATVNVADQNIGVVSIDAERGPTDVVTYISSERELVEIFGKPNSYNYESWFAASTMIQYGAVVAVIRPAVGTNLGLNNSNIKRDGTNDANLLIKNKDDFETRTANVYEWSARTAGKFNNGISVSVVDHGADQRIRVAKLGEIITTTNSAGTTLAGESDQSYAAVTGATSGGGTGATFTIARDSNGDVDTVTVTAGGTGYATADTITILGSTIGGVDSSGVATTTNTTGTTLVGEASSSYTDVTGATSGGGTGATFTIVRDSSGDVSTVTVTAGGTGYAAADTITILGSTIGGVDSTDDVTITVFTPVSDDVTITVGTVGLVAPSAGTYVQWTDADGNLQKGNVFKVDATETVEVEIVLWNTTKRLLGAETLYAEDETTVIATAEALLSNDVYAELEYATGRKWSSLGPQPGTSFGVADAGGRYDEFHIAVIDTDGLHSGVKENVLETLTFVSKASDARSAEGGNLYWRNVVANQSSFVYAGSQTFADTGDQLELLGQGTAVPIGDPRLDAVFKLFSFAGKSTESLKLDGGDDYDWVGNASGVADAIVKGYDFVEDRETFGDIDFLVPGKITASSAVRLIAIAEKRRDCIVVVSPLREDVINSNSSTKKTDDIIDFFKTLPSTSYAIYDSGYKYIYDKYNDLYRYVPCAADIAGLCFSTTINSETWFSPAGYNRGQVRNATKLAYSPRQAERDRLYTNRVNPVVAFPGQGIVLFGDKTALASPSAFDRINVRRLFIELEKNVAQFSKYQLFELNDELTRSGFRSAIEPYLRGIQGRRGIYDFLVVCDQSNNTGDVIDRNELIAEIYIKPARSINFITISFIATRTGVSFNELIN
mgnify:CR=1 FL=1